MDGSGRTRSLFRKLVWYPAWVYFSWSDQLDLAVSCQALAWWNSLSIDSSHIILRSNWLELLYLDFSLVASTMELFSKINLMNSFTGIIEEIIKRTVQKDIVVVQSSERCVIFNHIKVLTNYGKFPVGNSRLVSLAFRHTDQKCFQRSQHIINLYHRMNGTSECIGQL